MKTIDISLKGKDDINALVNITNRYPYTICLRQGRFVVDGKSILGVCSLSRSMPLIVEIYADDCGHLMDDLSPFMA